MSDDVLDDEPYKSRLWKSVEQGRRESDLIELRMKTVEHGYESLVQSHAEIMRTLFEIRNWQKDQDVSKAKIDGILIAHEKEIERLWAFPLKIAGAVLAIGGASGVVYGFVKWFVPSLEIRMPPH